MKFGQALSLFEAMLPEDIAAPFRERLRKLQDAAPPMPSSRAQAVLRSELGAELAPTIRHHRPATGGRGVHRAGAPRDRLPTVDRWPSRSSTRAPTPRWPATCARSSGWPGRCRRSPVAWTSWRSPGRSRPEWRRRSTTPWKAPPSSRWPRPSSGHPRFVVPQVHLATRRVLVSDWVDGAKLTSIIDRPHEERNRTALDYVTFLFAGPSLAGILHGDPHPGNYLVTPDGQAGRPRFRTGLPAARRTATDHGPADSSRRRRRGRAHGRRPGVGGIRRS